MRNISDLLDTYVDESVELGGGAPLSSTRIKELTMNKITENKIAEVKIPENKPVERKQAGPRRVLWPALVAAVLAAALLIPVCASAWRGWLEPVVSYGDNGALIEEYTVAVNETREGNKCDVTLENVVTDGYIIYCQFSAEYDTDFDLDDALEWGGLNVFPYSGLGQSSACWRVDDGSQPGKARFVCMTGIPGYQKYTPRALHGGKYNDRFLGWDFDSSQGALGETVCLVLRFHEWTGPQGTPRIAENYYFDVELNSTIAEKQLEWDDHTRLAVSPLGIYLAFNDWTGDYLNVPGEASIESWSRYWDELEVVLEFADGTRLDDASPHLKYHSQGGEHIAVWRHSYYGPWGELCAIMPERPIPQLIDPETVTALIINGVRYEVADAVG